MYLGTDQRYPVDNYWQLFPLEYLLDVTALIHGHIQKMM